MRATVITAVALLLIHFACAEQQGAWEELSQTNRPSERHAPLLISEYGLLSRNSLVLLGGFIKESGAPGFDAYRYDVSSGNWSTLNAPVEVGNDLCGGYNPAGGFCANTDKGYVLSGQDIGNNGGPHHTTMCVFAGGGSSLSVLPQKMPFGVRGAGIAEDSVHAKIYVVGGDMGIPDASNDVVEFSCVAETASIIPVVGTRPPARRNGGASMVQASRILIFGGTGVDSTGLLNDVWTFDVATSIWSQLTILPQPTARRYHWQLTESAGSVLIGYGSTSGSTYTDDVKRIRPHEGTEVDLVSSTGTAPSARRGQAGAVHNGSLFFFGGRISGSNGLNDFFKLIIAPPPPGSVTTGTTGSTGSTGGDDSSTSSSSSSSSSDPTSTLTTPSVIAGSGSSTSGSVWTTGTSSFFSSSVSSSTRLDDAPMPVISTASTDPDGFPVLVIIILAALIILLVFVATAVLARRRRRSLSTNPPNNMSENEVGGGKALGCESADTYMNAQLSFSTSNQTPIYNTIPDDHEAGAGSVSANYNTIPEFAATGVDCVNYNTIPGSAASAGSPSANYNTIPYDTRS